MRAMTREIAVDGKPRSSSRREVDRDRGGAVSQEQESQRACDRAISRPQRRSR
jgi:hypothetical protein